MIREKRNKEKLASYYRKYGRRCHRSERPSLGG